MPVQGSLDQARTRRCQLPNTGHHHEKLEQMSKEYQAQMLPETAKRESGQVVFRRTSSIFNPTMPFWRAEAKRRVLLTCFPVDASDLREHPGPGPGKLVAAPPGNPPKGPGRPVRAVRNGSIYSRITVEREDDSGQRSGYNHNIDRKRSTASYIRIVLYTLSILLSFARLLSARVNLNEQEQNKQQRCLPLNNLSKS